MDAKSMLYNCYSNTKDKSKRNRDIMCRISETDITDMRLCSNENIYALSILLSGGANIHQLKYLGIYGEYDKDKEFQYRCRLMSQVKKNFALTSQPYEQGTSKVYLCNSKLAHAYKELGEKIGISSDVLGALVDKRLTTKNINFSHSLAANDIRFFLYGYDGFPAFLYEREYSLIDKMIRGEKVDMRCDAMYTYRVGKYPSYHYVEADSGLQTGKVISNKLSRYFSQFGFDAGSGSISSIEFSCFTPESKYMSVKVSKSKSDFLDRKGYSALRIASLTIGEKKLSVLIDKLTQTNTVADDKYAFVSLNLFKHEITDALKLAKVLVSKGFVSLSDAEEESIKGMDCEQDRLRPQLIYDTVNSKYNARRELIFDLALKEPESLKCFTGGLNLTVLPNHDLYGAYPYVELAACGMVNTLIDYINSYTGQTLTISYAPFERTQLNMYGPVYYRNVLTSGNKKYIVENVSHNLGGRQRMKMLAKSRDFKNNQLQGICIVENYEDAIKFAKECSLEGGICTYGGYLEYSKSKGMAPLNKETVNLLLFITYKDIRKLKNFQKKGKGLFLLDS